MNVTILDSASAEWNRQIAQLTQRLPIDGQPFYFPLYFLQSTLPRIGGKVAIFSEADQEVAIGLLFPRFIDSEGNSIFTLRLHPLPKAESIQPPLTPAHILFLTNQQIDPAKATLYLPQAQHGYTQTSHRIGAIEMGRPSAAEAQQIPFLQQQVWGATAEETYPADLHSTEFSLGSSLVARVDEQVAGFLLGFYKFGGYPLPADWQERFRGKFRLESQIMGVLPQFRGLRIANLLKQQQALDALEAGIQIINWTTDPLQYANAALNFGLLRAISFDFLPNLYAFRNELNRVPASRLGLTWLVSTAHVQQNFSLHTRATVLDLAQHPEIPRANDGYLSANFELDAPILAFEIPANWNELQRNELSQAQQWREITDQLFLCYIGRSDGKYTITDVGIDGERRFLIGQRSNDVLWARLAKVA